jgi:hypothetical protein
MKDFAVLETLAAELAHATYAVALKHERAASWIDLELDLWRAVRETLHGRISQGAGSVDSNTGRL